MSEHDNATASAAITGMSANSKSDESVIDEGVPSSGTQNAFEEERKVVLENMEKSLTEVIQKMSKADRNLRALSNNHSEIKGVAELWHEVFSSEKTKKPSDDFPNQQLERKTSLSLNWPR